MRTVDTVLAWLVVVLGIIHTAATFNAARRFAMGSVWQFGAGAAVILAGLVNVIRIRIGRDAFVRATAIIGNFLLVAILLGVTFVAHHLRHDIHAILIWLIVLGELAFSLRGGH